MRTIRNITRIAGRGLLLGAVLGTGAAAPLACTWHTEHKIETVSRIDAHIVLDIRQIKADASQIEGYVRDQPTTGAATNTAAGGPTSYLDTEDKLRALADAGRGGWLSFAPRAAAQAPEKLPSSTDGDVKKAADARKDRLKAVNAALDKGAVGENELGYLEVLLPKEGGDQALRASMVKLADAENADRKTIYTALAKNQGGSAETIKAVGMVYAAAIREHLKKGQHYQVPRDKELYSDYQKTELGKAHADAKPGDWVVKKIDPPKKD